MKMVLLQRLTWAATILTLVVIVLGAYVRLSHAGLGCPDWPGCYGHLDVPKTTEEIATAALHYPDRPVVAAKAWKEMIHRYCASTLGLLIVMINIVAWRQRRAGVSQTLPLLLLGLVIFQGLLGMWTVTLLVKPVIVTAHLFGGLATLSLLWWLCLRYTVGVAGQIVQPQWRRALWLVLFILLAQIFLGGWTSTNYAALACYGFPQCNQQWWPDMHFNDAFILWRGLGIDYEGGVLEGPARVAIHLSHRIGAVITFLAISAMAITLLRHAQGRKIITITGVAMLAMLFLQITLGISNVLFGLPLSVATAHNGVAALLLLTIITALYFIRSPATTR
ncbi:MAG: COX15/CtaA family protein [Gammaproteobacteria bacterium]|nr:COX15/CtaA family protein [Gammaproteobacteria bacterium]